MKTSKEFYEMHHPMDIGLATKDECIKMMAEYATYVLRQLINSDTSVLGYDCDDCSHYPCVHQEIEGDDAKLKYNTCGDHSSRGCP